MSLGPASLRLAATRSVIPFIPELPRDSVALEDRSRNLDRLQDFLRSGKGKRDIEEVGARQVGSFDLADLLAEQLKPNNVPREPADLEERARGADFLSKLIRLGNRDIVEVDTRQVGGFDLTKLLAERLKPNNVPREPAELEDRARGADFLSKLIRLGNRDIEEVDARQVGGLDLATLVAKQLKPIPAPTLAHLPSEISDLQDRSRKSDSLLRILGLRRRDIEDSDLRQLGSFNLPHLVSSELAGRQIGSFDLPELLAHQFTREAQPDPVESSSKTLTLNRELAKELEEAADHVTRMIGRGLENTLD